MVVILKLSLGLAKKSIKLDRVFNAVVSPSGSQRTASLLAISF